MARVLNIVFNDFTRDSRVRKISRSLVSSGHGVRILCLWEEGLARNEVQDGFEVDRFEIRSRRWKSITLLRPLMFIEFALRSLSYLRKSDIVHVNDVEPLPIAIFLKILSLGRLKLIYDAHELESEKTGMRGVGKKMVKLIEQSAVPFLSGFITVSRSIGEIYRERLGLEPILIFNCPYQSSEVLKNQRLRNEFAISNDATIFIYQGGLAPKRGLDFLMRGFEQMQNERVHLVILGFGPLESQVKAVADRCPWIHFKPGVPMDKLLEVTAGSDIGFSLLSKDSLNHEFALPNKFFEYISAQIPVIVSPVKEMSSLVQERDLGWVMPSNSAEGVIEVVRQVIVEGKRDRSQQLQELAEEYVWEVQEKKLISLYRQVLDK